MQTAFNMDGTSKMKITPGRCTTRQQLSSSFKLKYLSPASATMRKKATQIERLTDKGGKVS